MPKKILIVDDEPEICQGISEYLTEAGYLTSVAHRGTEALRKATEDTPDLIILDIAMPDLEGTQIYQNLMRSPKNRKIRVLFLTALASGAPVQLQGIDNTRYSLLSKPAPLESIQQEIERLLALPDD